MRKSKKCDDNLNFGESYQQKMDKNHNFFLKVSF